MEEIAVAPSRDLLEVPSATKRTARDQREGVLLGGMRRK